MPNPVGSILRAATRPEGGPLRILTFPTHERFQTGLARCNARFFLFRGQGIKDWNRTYATLPANHTLLDPSTLPAEVDFDLVLSQNKFGQFQVAHQLAKQLHLPLVSLEHTLPVPSWSHQQVAQLKAMRGNVNVFISEFSREKWGWSPEEALAIHHGVDTELFRPNDLIVKKKRHALSVCNDWKNRDWCCGFSLWQEVIKGLPVFVVGDNPGLSKPARSVAELVMRYREAQVFLNTSLVSPVPTALLEAMSCGCAVVSTSTCMIPEFIENGENGFISNDPVKIHEYTRMLLADEQLCRQVGQKARDTITERFSMARFVSAWDGVFKTASKIAFIG